MERTINNEKASPLYCWRKLGGGSLRWGGYIIKRNQTFFATMDDLSEASRRNLTQLYKVPGEGERIMLPLPASEKLRVYYVPKELSSPRFARAFAKGCRGRLLTENEYELGAWAAFGSPKVWFGLEQSQQMGFDWYYGDHGYLNRGRSYRVTRNAYQMAYIQTDGYKETKENKKRLERLHVKKQHWKKDGRNILVCPPDRMIAQIFRFSALTWKRKITKQIREYTDRPIVFRERSAKTPLSEAFEDAWFLVTAFSNVAVDAVIAGLPVHCTMPCAAFPMSTGLEDIEDPVYPENRREWLLNLCANQWTLKEIANGMCWNRIGRAV